jgi:hypothetical protein
MNNPNTQHLLEQVSVISKKYKDIAKITGENFNIFQILNLSTLEVSLHSKLIAELLNPNGSHEQGILFLKLFIDECGLTDFLLDAELEQTNVAIEVGVGKIDENYESGGRIDIVLKFNNGKIILIENKIYAEDQYNQLVRYKQAYPNAKIVYLNLWGDNEEIEEVGGLNKSDFIWISYKDNVTSWLTKSLKEIYNKPNIVYILEHYLKTVKTITNQNTNSVMNKELINSILQSEGNISAAFEISNVLHEIRKQTAHKLIKQIQNEIFENLKQKGFNIELIEDSAVGRHSEWAGYKFEISNTPFKLYVYFNGDYCDLLIGLKAELENNQRDEDMNIGIREKIQQNTHTHTRKWLYAWMQKEEFIYNQLDENPIYEINNGISIDKLTNLFDNVLSSVKS